MPNPRIRVGSVMQIDPEHDRRFGACFLTVTELKSWGVQGFVAIPGSDGAAYYRCAFEHCEYIGQAEWIHAPIEEEPADA